MNSLAEAGRQALSDVQQRGTKILADAAAVGTNDAEQTIRETMDRMLRKVPLAEENSVKQKFAGVNEDDVLSFVHDRRSLGWVSVVLLGIFVLIVSSGAWQLLSLPLFGLGLVLFVLRYVFNAHVDVPEGYEGVATYLGKPLAGERGRAKPGRNWYFNYFQFVSFLASVRDQVVQMRRGNFTRDFSTVALGMQITFTVEDPAKFIENTTAAGVMKLIDLYASYITLRIITSTPEASVKFGGRERLPNVIAALDAYLSRYGIKITRASMPTVENEILNLLESIRTSLKAIDALRESRRVKLEAAVKGVESDVRRNVKDSQNEALQLRQRQITFETAIAQQVNSKRQTLLIQARSQIEEQYGRVKAAIGSFRAKLEKAKALKRAFAGLKTQLSLREAALKRSIQIQLIPRHVQILDVEGIGQGVGLGMANHLTGALYGAEGSTKAR